MTLQTIILLAVQASIILTVFAIGLDATAREATWLLRRPGKLLRSLAAMNIIMPAFVLAVAALVPLNPAVKVALIALAVSPVPPFLPGKVKKSGGTESYIIGLLAAAAVAAIVLIPLAIGFLGWAYGVDTHISTPKIAKVVFMTVIAPLGVGIGLRALAPDFIARIVRPVGIFATVLLVVSVLPLIVKFWPLMMALIGNGTILVFVAFILVGLAVGHALGGPEPDDRTVLAFATATRHPGVAIAITAANFSDQKSAIAAILLFVLLGIIVMVPYSLWRKRCHARGDTAPQSASSQRTPLNVGR